LKRRENLEKGGGGKEIKASGQLSLRRNKIKREDQVQGDGIRGVENDLISSNSW